MFNPAQLKLHELIEAQKAKTGRVRVVILKARQLGVSTYVAARLYHRTINSPGTCEQLLSATNVVLAQTCSKSFAAFTTTCRKALGRVSERATRKN